MDSHSVAHAAHAQNHRTHLSSAAGRYRASTARARGVLAESAAASTVLSSPIDDPPVAPHRGLRGHRVTWGRQRVALERGRQARIRPPRARGVARGRHMTHGMAPHAILVRLLLLPLHGGCQGGRPQRHPPRKHLVSPGARRLKNSDARRLAVALLRSFPEDAKVSWLDI